MTNRDDAWFVLTLRDIEGDGVELPRLSRLLESLSTSFYAIAREKAGLGGARPGPKTPKEEALAAVRLVRVEPGSTVIELAPPPTAAQAQLAIADEPTPDDVAFEFFEEARRIEAGEPIASGRSEIRRRVRAVVDEAAHIAGTADIEFRPLFPRPERQMSALLRASLHTRDLPEETRVQRQIRHRRVSGHAYMVDVEPGRQRLRVKMPDGRDITVEVHESITERLPASLDHVVELQVDEEYEGTALSSRVAREVVILPSSGPGSDKPPKSLEELEKEQGLPKERPDYVALASRIWETEEDIAEFQEHVAQLRTASTA